jgi:hypothetical protein
MADSLEPLVRHLKSEHNRSVVGYDTLEVSPRDKFGNFHLDVIVNHFTTFVNLILSKTRPLLAPHSLVDRHESNGVEGTNKQTLRHLRALTQEENIKSEWSSPSVLSIIENLF